MRAKAQGRAINRGIGPRDIVSSVTNRLRILAKDRAEAAERTRVQIAGPTLQERQADLVEYYESYEDFVEVLCDAAQYGPTNTLEKRYADLHAKITSAYTPVRPFLYSFVRETPDGGHTDPFLELTEAPTLSEFLHRDDGLMIDRITRTREAVNLYGEHLRQLAARRA